MAENPAIEEMTRGRVRRKVASSAKAKSEKMKLRRAAKNGDADAAKALSALSLSHRNRIDKSSNIASDNVEERTYAAGLESRFMRLSEDWETFYKTNTTMPFKRPISDDQNILFPEVLQPANRIMLKCPKRPAWSKESTKRQVETNEQLMFGKWLAETDAALASTPPTSATEGPMQEPSHFERNLTVWRQLWRVCEMAEIVMIILDARCPLLHWPPSLRDYVRSCQPRKAVILVLTKCDLVGPQVAAQWKKFLDMQEEEECEEGHRASVVCLQNYVEKVRGENQQGLGALAPGSSISQRRSLLSALKEAHSQTPDKASIDWEALLVASPDAAQYEHASEDTDSTSNTEKRLRIGIIGQPNVGKSSLLNALLGGKVVSASSTPGHTKILQTINWARQITLIDCPGLTCPSYVGMRLQVLASVIPIQSAEAVVEYISHSIPLEHLLKVEKPKDYEERPPMVLTGRNGTRITKTFEFQWSADSLLSAFALKKGYVNARAGRPDVARAGAAILKLLQSSVIPWAFRPMTSDEWPDCDGAYLKTSDAERRWEDQIIADQVSTSGASESESDSAGSSSSEGIALE